MDKPKKKETDYRKITEFDYGIGELYQPHRNSGYNQACDDRDKWEAWIVSELKNLKKNNHGVDGIIYPWEVDNLIKKMEKNQ